jgi:hypothetical protein
VNARLAGTVAGLCDDPELKEKLCKGFDSQAFARRFPGKSLHEILYGVALSDASARSSALHQFVKANTKRAPGTPIHSTLELIR